MSVLLLFLLGIAMIASPILSVYYIIQSWNKGSHFMRVTAIVGLLLCLSAYINIYQENERYEDIEKRTKVQMNLFEECIASKKDCGDYTSNLFNLHLELIGKE